MLAPLPSTSQPLLNVKNYLNLNLNTNIAPHPSFTKSLNKKVLNSFTNKAFNENLIPWYQHTFVRFIEDCTGKKILLQYYPFLSQTVDAKAFTRYKMWLRCNATETKNLWDETKSRFGLANLTASSL